jgi:WD40 repeat protein
VRVWDSATGETVAELETKEREEANLLPGAVTALAIAGGCVWGGTNNGVLHVWDLDSLELVAQLGADEDGVPEEQRHAGGIEALAVLDSVAGRAWAGGTQGPAVLTGCGDGAVRLWAADETRRCLAALKGHSVGAFALCLSDEHPDQLLTGSFHRPTPRPRGPAHAPRACRACRERAADERAARRGTAGRRTGRSGCGTSRRSAACG